MEKNKKEQVEEFIKTLTRSFLVRKKIKDINELSDEEVYELFEKTKDTVKGFMDYNDEIGKIVDNRRDYIIDYRRKLKDEEFIKSMRHDRSLNREGTNPLARLKSIPIDNLKGYKIETAIDTENKVLKLNDNLKFKNRPQKMNIKDALKIDTPEAFAVSIDERDIMIYPVNGIKYKQDEFIKGNVQKYLLTIKDKQKEMSMNEYVYTNSLDGEKYKKDKKYKEKVDYLLSRENINGSKKLMGYLGEITRDNRVIDDENNFVAIRNYEEKGKEAQKLLNKLKGKYQSDERKNDESR